MAKKIAYCGVEGAFAYIAAKQIYPDEEYVAFSTFAKAYHAVQRKECDRVVLPIENSYAGEVTQVFDLMFSGDLHIKGFYNLPISQNLLGLKGAKLEDIKEVSSHPQALMQCEDFLNEHGFITNEESNTAIAAKKVIEENDITKAAVASTETARIYGLDIIASDINESKDNTTRFAVFSRHMVDEESLSDKSSFMLLFTVKNKAGSLVKALQTLGDFGFNMTMIHSRPLKTLAFRYYFVIEAEGDSESENGMDMIDELRKHCDMLKVIGRYST